MMLTERQLVFNVSGRNKDDLMEFIPE